MSPPPRAPPTTRATTASPRRYTLPWCACLERAPWTPQQLEAVAARDPNAAERTRLRSELAQGEAQLQANAVAFAAVGDISDHAVKAFRAVAQTISRAYLPRQHERPPAPEEERPAAAEEVGDGQPGDDGQPEAR